MSEAPPLVVLEDPLSLPDLRAALRAEGWTVTDGFPPLEEAWPLADPRLVCVGAVDGEAQRSAAIRAAARGAGLVILAANLDPVFEEDLARLGPIVRHLAGGLTPRMLALLLAQANGSSMKAAARELHISDSTAWRAMRAARSTLGVATNTEAVVEAQRRVGQ